MAFNYNIFWTDKALNGLNSILSYLSNNFTSVEAEKFKHMLSRQLHLIQQNPYLFPVSQYNSRLRKATLSRQVIVFYEISKENIYLILIFNTQQNIRKIK